MSAPPSRQIAPLQHPLHEDTSQTQSPCEQCWPEPQAWQLTPPAPHALSAVPPMQVLFTQQPLHVPGEQSSGAEMDTTQGTSRPRFTSALPVPIATVAPADSPSIAHE